MKNIGIIKISIVISLLTGCCIKKNSDKYYYNTYHNSSKKNTIVDDSVCFIEIGEGDTKILKIKDINTFFEVYKVVNLKNEFVIISKNNDSLKIFFEPLKIGEFENSDFNNLILPSSFQLKDSFQIIVKKEVVTIYEFNNETFYDNSYSSSSSSLIMKPYIPLIFIYSPSGYKIEIEKKGYFRDVFKALKKNTNYLRFIEKPRLPPVTNK